MFGRFERRPASPVLGLDISSTSVKLLELSRTRERYRVESYCVCPLPGGAVVEKGIVSVDEVAGAIRSVVARSRTRLKAVAAAVAGSSVITRLLDMPAGLSDDDMEAQLALEADQFIPYSPEEVALDFGVLGASSSGADQVEVLLAACRRETIDSRVAAIEAAGLQARIMDVEAYAMARSLGLMRDLPAGGAGHNVAVVDVGATTTTLNVCADGRPIYTREQLFGGKHLTDEIMRRYGLPVEEAGLAKKRGGLPDDYEPELLEPFQEALQQQVARSLQLFFASSQHSDVERIVLAGGVAALRGLGQRLQERLDIPCAIANPLADMAISPRVAAVALSDDATALMIACGLALRSFD